MILFMFKEIILILFDIDYHPYHYCFGFSILQILSGIVDI